MCQLANVLIKKCSMINFQCSSEEMELKKKIVGTIIINPPVLMTVCIKS